MPTLAEATDRPIKAMILGDSGVGKTGAMFSLLEAGYKIKALDFDNGLDILVGIARQRKKENLLTNVDYVTCTDEFHTISGKIVCKAAKAWSIGMNQLDKWKVNQLERGTILLLDSLTFAGRSAVRFVQQLNSRLAVPPWQSDYNIAQQQLEAMISLLCGDSTKCDVVVCTHVRQQGTKITTTDSENKVISYEEEGTRKGFPETGTGRALSPTIGRHFNSVLLVDIEGTGLSTKRVIRTVPYENIGLKNSIPGLAKPSYPLESGLADYFAAIRSGTAHTRAATQ